MKLKYSWKRLSLVAIVLMVAGGLMLLPTAMGTVGGATIGAAPTVQPGVYPNEVRLSSNSLYYNVSGIVGANLTVIVTWAGMNCSDVMIWAPNGTLLEHRSASYCSDCIVVASVICDSKRLYTIGVMVPVGVKIPGDIIFTLSICLDGDCGQGNGIPGFNLLIGSFSLVLLLGVVLLLSQRNKHFL
jgi:hypothetical protein